MDTNPCELGHDTECGTETGDSHLCCGVIKVNNKDPVSLTWIDCFLSSLDKSKSELGNLKVEY